MSTKNENEFPSIGSALEAFRELQTELEGLVASLEADISPEIEGEHWQGEDNLGDYLDKALPDTCLEKESWRKLWAIASVLS